MNWFNHLYQNIYRKKFAFFTVFFIVTLITYAVLYWLDIYPEPQTNNTNNNNDLVTEEVSGPVIKVEASAPESKISKETALPTRIVIPKSDTDVIVLNPESLDMNDLDKALLNGVARHPQSADFDNKGNILIFGHSSYLPNVFNKNFQALNGVQNLNWGDEIMLYASDGTEYVYRVNRVYSVKASETIIDNTRGKSTLTIVTCNSFGSKDDRFIVEAILVDETV